MNYKKEIIKLLSKELKENIDENIIEIPPNPDLGDYSFPCFSLSKKLKKSPIEIANSLQKLKHPNFKIQSEGPYLNFFVDKTKLIKDTINKILKEKEKYGYSNLGKNKKVMIEFFNHNTHKPLHVGHLRNTVYGDFLSRLYEFTNHKTIPVSYLGDIGTHVAKSLWALQKYHKNEKPPKNKGKYLGKVYSEAATKLEKSPKLMQEVYKVLQKLESKDPKLVKRWKETRKWSLDEMKEVAKQLNIKIDKYFLESQVEKPGQKIVYNLFKKGIAIKDQGAILIDLEKYGLKKFLLRKSDGTSLYSTKDLALAKIKFKDYKIDESLYVVGQEQTFYFKQLFKTLEVMGFKKEMKHISYGLVKLNGKKIASRKGYIFLYEDFYDELLKKTTKDLNKRYKNWAKSKIENVSNFIVLGAIKFSMLNQDSNKEIDFNIKTALSFEGDTCPYIQYSNARINSILTKTNIDKPKYDQLKHPLEFKIIKHLSLYPEIIQKTKEKDSPHILTNYILGLCHMFNEFYHKCPVIKAEKGLKGARINILLSIKQIIENSFKLFNIPLPKEM